MATSKTGFNPNNRDHVLALDLWEITRDFGTTPVGPLDWTRRYGKTRRSWERLLSRVRSSPYPVEFVPAEGRPQGPSRDPGEPEATLNPTMRALGVQFPRGANSEFTKILDNLRDL